MPSDDNDNQASLSEFDSASIDANSGDREDHSEVNDDTEIRAAECVETLRQAAIEEGWHLQQGKGASEDATYEQDLLAHTMDVVHITFNIVNGLGLVEDEGPLKLNIILSAAFFHDLHKRENVGSTVSMEADEVEDMLTAWEMQDELSDELTIEMFTDVIKSIHQYHGDSDSRASIATDPALLTLVNIVRLADVIASVDSLDDLWGNGWQDPLEPLESLGAVIGTDYTLGYHQLSTVRPALSAVIHDAVETELTQRDACLLGTRTDAAIYAIPLDEGGGSAIDDPEIATSIAERVRGQVTDSTVREAIPDKLQETLYGPSDAIGLRMDEQRTALQREQSGPDLERAARSVAQTDGNVEQYKMQQGGSSLLTVDDESECILIKSPLTERGSIVGEALSLATKVLANEKDRLPDADSRVDIVEELAGSTVDLEEFNELHSKTAQSTLPRIVGNHLFEQSDDSASHLINQIEERATGLLDQADEGDEDLQSLVSISAFEKQVQETVSVAIRDESDAIRPLQTTLPQSIEPGLNYDESCVLCGAEATHLFRTSRGSAFKKSYLARGLAGKDMSDTGWNLCETCFLDYALFRAFADSASRFNSAEDAVFLKVVPNRYLGPAQAELLRQRFGEDGAFGSIYEDSERHLEANFELSDAESFGFIETEQPSFATEYRVTFEGQPQASTTSFVVESPHFFLIAVQDYDDTPEVQVTKTWLKAILRALILVRYHNLSVIIDAHPTMPTGGDTQLTGGVHLNNPPSQIRAVFADHLAYDDVDATLDGLAALVYSTGQFHQYDGPDDLNQTYDALRTSMVPGGKLYRAAERELEGNVPAGEVIKDAHLLADLLNQWRSDSGLGEIANNEAINTSSTHGSTMSESETVNRIEEVIDAFGLSASYDASPFEIQSPLRTMVNKILEQQGETKEEIITQAAGQIYRRVERRMGNSDRSIYFETDEEESPEERVRNGCRVFYERIYVDMLGADQIQLANRRSDILDGCYLVIRERRIYGGETASTDQSA